MCACYASLRVALIASRNEALSEQPGICFARQAEKQLPSLGECADYGPTWSVARGLSCLTVIRPVSANGSFSGCKTPGDHAV